MLIIGKDTPRTLRRQLLTFLLVAIALLSILSAVIGAWVGSSQSRTMLVNNSLQIAGNLAERSILSLITASQENADLTAIQSQGRDHFLSEPTRHGLAQQPWPALRRISK